MANLEHGGDRRSDQAANLPLVTQCAAAKMLNVGDRSLRSAKRVAEDATPELMQAVERGAVSVSAAAENAFKLSKLRVS